VILPRPVTGLENDCDETSSINSDDLLHPDELFSGIWKRSDAESCEALVAHKTMDNGSETSSATSKVRGIGVPGESHPDVADDGRNDEISPDYRYKNSWEESGRINASLSLPTIASRPISRSSIKREMASSYR
jgi:hypothetical protein